MKIVFNNLTDEKFKEIKDYICKKQKHCKRCIFYGTHCGLYANDIATYRKMLDEKILNKEFKIKDEILLNNKEKEYLKAVIKPFRNRIIFIEKRNHFRFQYIAIAVKALDKNSLGEDSINDIICLPKFKVGTQYKFLKLDIQYKLEDLGL